jgi:hypothetical protein
MIFSLDFFNDCFRGFLLFDPIVGSSRVKCSILEDDRFLLGLGEKECRDAVYIDLLSF